MKMFGLPAEKSEGYENLKDNDELDRAAAKARCLEAEMVKMEQDLPVYQANDLMMHPPITSIDGRISFEEPSKRWNVRSSSYATRAAILVGALLLFYGLALAGMVVYQRAGHMEPGRDCRIRYNRTLCMDETGMDTIAQDIHRLANLVNPILPATDAPTTFRPDIDLAGQCVKITEEELPSRLKREALKEDQFYKTVVFCTEKDIIIDRVPLQIPEASLAAVKQARALIQHRLDEEGRIEKLRKTTKIVTTHYINEDGKEQIMIDRFPIHGPKNKVHKVEQ